jgi:hypothetical protein
VDDKGKTKIWIDGKEALGVTEIKFEAEVNSLPIVKVEFFPQMVNFGGEMNEKQQ